VIAVFCDRDGTLIDDVPYLADPEGVRIIDDAVVALRGARAAGYEVVIVTNQSGVARGLISPDQLAAVNRRVLDGLSERGIDVRDVRACIHGPDDGCACRKPLPGMITAAAAALDIDLGRSVMVGDAERDVRAGEVAGVGLNWLLGADTAPVGETVAAGTWAELAERMGWGRG
jgi:histidinol-phosphate phosphatase family protein